MKLLEMNVSKIKVSTLSRFFGKICGENVQAQYIKRRGNDVFLVFALAENENEVDKMKWDKISEEEMQQKRKWEEKSDELEKSLENEEDDDNKNEKKEEVEKMNGEKEEEKKGLVYQDELVEIYANTTRDGKKYVSVRLLKEARINFFPCAQKNETIKALRVTEKNT